MRLLARGAEEIFGYSADEVIGKKRVSAFSPGNVVLGHIKIKTLVNQSQDAGNKIAMWDGTDDLGRQVSAGVYLYQIKAGEFTQTRKMLLLK